MSAPRRGRAALAARLTLLGSTAAGTGAALLALLGVGPEELVQLVAAFGSSHSLRVVTLGSAFVGLLGGVLGSFAVLRGQSLLGDAVSHAALPGIYLAFGLWSAIGAEGMRVLGTTLPAARSLPVVLAGALLTGGLAALGVLLVARATRLGEDAAMALMLSTFFGAGLVLRSLLQQGSGQRAGLESFLFGTAATISSGDAGLIGATTLAVILVLVLLWKELQLLAFDPDYLATLGFPVRAIDIGLTGLLVLSVITGLQVVGVILMSAMLIAPAVAARQWTDRLPLMVLLAAGFGLLSALVGVAASYLRAGLATGPVIALCVTSLALGSLLLAPGRGLLWAWQRRRRRDRAFAVDTLVLHLAEQGQSLAPTQLQAQLGWPRLRLRRSLRRGRRAGWLHLADRRVAISTAGRARATALLAELGTPSTIDQEAAT